MQYFQKKCITQILTIANREDRNLQLCLWRHRNPQPHSMKNLRQGFQTRITFFDKVLYSCSLFECVSLDKDVMLPTRASATSFKASV